MTSYIWSEMNPTLGFLPLYARWNLNELGSIARMVWIPADVALQGFTSQKHLSKPEENILYQP